MRFLDLCIIVWILTFIRNWSLTSHTFLRLIMIFYVYTYVLFVRIFMKIYFKRFLCRNAFPLLEQINFLYNTCSNNVLFIYLFFSFNILKQTREQTKIKDLIIEKLCKSKSLFWEINFFKLNFNFFVLFILTFTKLKFNYLNENISIKQEWINIKTDAYFFFNF